MGKYAKNTTVKDINNLKEFARSIIKDYCWDLGDPDGGSVQDLAEKLGLIEPHIATEADVDPEWDDYEAGDTVYRFSEILRDDTDNAETKTKGGCE